MTLQKNGFLFLAGLFLKEKGNYNKIFHFQKTVSRFHDFFGQNKSLVNTG